MHRSHTHSDHCPGHKSVKEEFHRTVGQLCEKIGLNEANLINDVHLTNIFL